MATKVSSLIKLLQDHDPDETIVWSIWGKGDLDSTGLGSDELNELWLKNIRAIEHELDYASESISLIIDRITNE